MTDARLKGEWLTAAAHDGLSDAAYRIFHNALMHSAEQGTDGAIADRELRFLYPGAIEPSSLEEIEAAGFWERTPTGYQFLGWDTVLGQSTAATIEDNRRKARERMQKVRNERKGATGTPSDSQVPRSEFVRPNVRANVTGNVTRHVGQERTGQERPPGGGLPVRSKRRAGTRERALHPVPDCNVDGHHMDRQGITCLRPNCEYRDRDRQAQYAAGTLGGTP